MLPILSNLVGRLAMVCFSVRSSTSHFAAVASGTSPEFYLQRSPSTSMRTASRPTNQLPLTTSPRTSPSHTWLNSITSQLLSTYSGTSHPHLPRAHLSNLHSPSHGKSAESSVLRTEQNVFPFTSPHLTSPHHPSLTLHARLLPQVSDLLHPRPEFLYFTSKGAWYVFH